MSYKCSLPSLALLLTFAAWGCGGHKPIQHQVRAYRLAGFSAAESLYYLGDENACGFAAVRRNPDPADLVREYNRRDHNGEFLRTNAWIDTVYDCPGHLPGPDEFRVVRDGDVVSSISNDSIVRVLVTSHLLGMMRQDSAGPTFESLPATVTDTFEVILTPYGWRIRSPQLPDNVSASWALEHVSLRDQFRDSLRRSVNGDGPPVNAPPPN